MKLNRNTLCPDRLSCGRIRNDGINSKLLACVERDLEETKDAMCILPLMLLQLLPLCNLKLLR